VLDENGRFYLAVTDTQHNRLNATGIPASFIKDEMESCRSKRQILVLDCCHSGAFARGAKGVVGLNAITRATFESVGGYGQVVLTATDSTQYALEGDQVIGNVETSLFTHFLIQGLRSGEADTDHDGRITVDELYGYVYEQVRAQTPSQTPRKWEQGREGDELVIARSQYRATDLPPELRQLIESRYPATRESAVRELEQLLRGSNKSLSRLAHGVLNILAREDDSLRVRDVAATVLKAYEETKRPRATTPLPPTSPKPMIPPISGPPPAGPPVTTSSARSPNRKWLLWGGIVGVLIIVGLVLVLGGFVNVDDLFPPVAVVTVTPPLTTTVAPTVDARATAQAVVFATETSMSQTATVQAMIAGQTATVQQGTQQSVAASQTAIAERATAQADTQTAISQQEIEQAFASTQTAIAIVGTQMAIARQATANAIATTQAATSPTPTPTSTPTPTPIPPFRLIDKASTARWFSDPGPLPWNGRPNRAQDGAASIVNDHRLEDQQVYPTLLFTHPAYTDYWLTGYIIGEFDVPVVGVGQHFLAKVGLEYGSQGPIAPGATPSPGAGVIVQVTFNGDVLYYGVKIYTGALATIDVDLSRYARQSGMLSIMVGSNGSSGRDWFCWVDPRIDYP